MHRHHRARGKILFEVFCASGLAASLAGAWDQTGSSALLASASIMALFTVYWSFGLFARDRSVEALEEAVPVTASVADGQEVEVAVAQSPAPYVEAAVQEEAFVSVPEVLPEPEAVAAEPKKQRARKTTKKAGVVAPAGEAPEPVAVEETVYDGPPLQQLFEPQPFVRQPRPAFGRKARGPRPIPAA